MKINKSSRHPKITGDFAELFTLYWLSKFGSECVHVDHTGIDLLARLPKSKKIIGISVKSRSRLEGKEFDSINISIKDINSAKIASETFNAIPYFSIVIDSLNYIYIFFMPLKTLEKYVPIKNKTGSFKAKPKDFEVYKKDPTIWTIELAYKIPNSQIFK